MKQGHKGFAEPPETSSETERTTGTIIRGGKYQLLEVSLRPYVAPALDIEPTRSRLAPRSFIPSSSPPMLLHATVVLAVAALAQGEMSEILVMPDSES